MYKKNVIIIAQTAIIPYHRIGKPGIIAGLSHDGKLIANKGMKSYYYIRRK